MGETAWTSVNNVSTHSGERDSELSDSEIITLPLTASRGQLMALDVREQEDSEPKNEDLQRIVELMDGFKASKVVRNKRCTQNMNFSML